jgi:hypothetical protein
VLEVFGGWRFFGKAVVGGILAERYLSVFLGIWWGLAVFGGDWRRRSYMINKVNKFRKLIM